MSEQNPEPILSEDETAALLDAMRTGASLEGASSETRPGELGAPDAPMRRAIAKADQATPRVSTALREVFLRMTALTVDVRETPSEIVPTDVALAAFEEGGASWEMVRHRPVTAAAPGRDSSTQTIAIGAVAIGPGLCHFVLEKRLGASDALLAQRKQPATPKPLSALDRRVLEPLARGLIEGFFEAFEGVGEDVSLSQKKRPETEASVRFAPTLRLSFKATLPNGNVEDVAIVLSGAAFIPAPKRDAQGRSDKERVAAVLGSVSVDLVAELGRASMSVRELLAIESGGVIRLDRSPEKPLTVRVDGEPVLRGMPVVEEGNLAIDVTETIAINAVAPETVDVEQVAVDKAVVEQAVRELLGKLDKADKPEGKNHDRRAA